MIDRSDVETGEAQFRLAEAYEDGLGVAYDLNLAIALYEKSAKLGHQKAAYFLGHYYFVGIEELGIEEDFEKAAIWYRLAAELGYSETQCELGKMYRDGVGVLQNDEEAARWLLKAAEQGHRGVSYHLAEMYQSGEGVPEDNVQAYMWYKIAGPGSEFDKLEIKEITSLKENMSRKDVNRAEALATDWIEKCMAKESWVRRKI